MRWPLFVLVVSSCSTQVAVLTSASSTTDSSPEDAAAPDGTVDGDAVPATPTGGHYLQLEPVAIQIESIEHCSPDPIVVVHFSISGACASLAEPRARYDEVERQVVLEGLAWVEHGADECEAGKHEGSRVVRLLSTGQWTIRAEGASESFNVEAPPAPMASTDCQAPDVSCAEECIRTCLSDLDCSAGSVCSDRRCITADADACGPSAACSAPLECDAEAAPSFCDWPAERPGSLGDPCVEDDECEAGVRCVRDARSGARHCALPCSSQIARCPQTMRCDGLTLTCRDDAILL